VVSTERITAIASAPSFERAQPNTGLAPWEWRVC
jgi:hypothetical protein